MLPLECPPGEKDCGAGCVPISTDVGCGGDSCAPCADLPNANERCNVETGLCQFAACDVGFADCDGDTSRYDGQSEGNGCEYEFALGSEIRPAPVQPLEVPRATAITIDDGSRDDWQGIPAYQLLQPCNITGCDDDTLPGVIAQNEVPPRSDLDAYFRVAWNQDFFYVLGDVYDSRLIANGADRREEDGRCQNGAPCEDALTVFFDGHNDRTAKDGYGFDDSRVFLGLGGEAYRVSGSLAPGDVDLRSVQHTPACYRIEAQIAWGMIVGIGPGGTLEGQFPPAPSQNYGFDISVNDWDPGASDQTPRRESHLFWLSPGPEYHFRTSGFGAMRLVEQVTAAPSNPTGSSPE